MRIRFKIDELLIVIYIMIMIAPVLSTIIPTVCVAMLLVLLSLYILSKLYIIKVRYLLLIVPITLIISMRIITDVYSTRVAPLARVF